MLPGFESVQNVGSASAEAVNGDRAPVGRAHYGADPPSRPTPISFPGVGASSSESIEGDKHFALWRLEDAADACFGTKAWPADLPVPAAWIEFDVANMADAVAELEAAGHRLLVTDRKEPWGQIVTRLLSPEGLLVGVTITPWMREPAGAAASAG